MLPGFGTPYRGLMGMYSRLTAAVCYLHDRTVGTVELADRGSPAVSYRLVDEDKQALLEGLRTLADIYFAAGAQQVVLPYNDFVVLRRRGAYRALI